MWNENIPPAFRYTIYQHVFSYLVRYPHTVPVNALLATHFFLRFHMCFHLFYFETTPLEEYDDLLTIYNNLGRSCIYGDKDTEHYLNVWGSRHAGFLTAKERSTFVAIYTPALIKIDKILGGYDIGFPETRIHAKDMPTYSRFTSRAMSFMKSTINFDVSPVKNIINDFRDREVRVEQPKYRRIKNIPTEYKGIQPKERIVRRIA